MRNETRKQFDAYLAQLAKLNGVNSAVRPSPSSRVSSRSWSNVFRSPASS